jgi:predicted esterase
MRSALLVLAWVAFASNCAAAPKVIDLPPTKEISKAHFLFESFAPDPRGVLVLINSVHRPAEEMMADAAWRQFAGDAGLAICAVGLDSSDAVLRGGRGYLDSRSGSLALLARALAMAGFGRQSLYVFGLREGGAFANLLANLPDTKVKAWASHANGRFCTPARNIPYGIISAGDLSGRNYDAAKAYFEASRAAGASLGWVTLHQARMERRGEVEQFVRNSFSEILNQNRIGEAVVVGNQSKQPLLRANQELPRNTSVLVSRAVLEEWERIHYSERIFTQVVPTGVPGFPEMVLTLRMPTAAQARPRILAYSSFLGEAANVVSVARDDTFFWNRFADQRGMAVVTWNSRTLWEGLKNFDQIGAAQLLQQQRVFTAIVRAWEIGISQLAKQHNLEESRILIFGSSQGANFATRLVMHDPSRFSAALIHIGNSFDKPTPEAARVVWAVTNGDLDVGVANAKRFYENCRALGYPIFFRLLPVLGHNENDESRKFASDFFDFVRNRERLEGNLAAKLIAEMSAPSHVADATNYLVFPISKAASVPVKQRVYLPNADLARLWGRMIEH